MKPFVLALFLLFTVNLLFAREGSFHEGYIITNGNDTVYGEIENNSYNENSRVCRFLNSSGKDVHEYYPGEISGYRFIHNGKFYVSKILKGRPVFMEYLVNGKLDIYFYQDEEKENRFYAGNDSISLYELKYSEGIKEDKGRMLYFENTQFKGALNYLTMDCPALHKEIDEMSMPNHKDLIKVAKKYHDMTCLDGACEIYEKKMPRRIMAVGSYGYMLPVRKSLEIQSEGFFSLPFYGIDFLFQISEVSEKFFIGLGLYNLQQKNQNNLLIPVSFNYLDTDDGLSPFFSYKFETTHVLEAGMRYQKGALGLGVSCAMFSDYIIIPILFSPAIKLSYRLH